MTSPTIWFIHGAGATARSFVWLRSKLPTHHGFCLTYSKDESLSSVIERFSKINQKRPVIVVGHSLGGLVALGLHDRPFVKGIITLCSPLGGLASAGLMSIFSKDHLFRDLNSFGPTMKNLQSINITKPMLSIVATNGLPVTKEVNDGVVTLSSATAMVGPKYISLPLNHFEVLLDEDVVTLVTQFISEI